MLFKHHEKDVQGVFYGTDMLSEVMQDLPSTGVASGAGAAQEQRQVGRQSIKHYLLAQPSSPPRPRGPMAC